MKIVQAPRASAILYHLLASQINKYPWLLPANICPIVPITFLKAGVPFELIDISAETLNMDLEQAEARSGKRTYGGLLYAHTYGEASTPHEFFSRLKNKFPTLLIVDDRCLCVPDVSAAQDSMTDVQLYSTGYAKIVDLSFGGYAFLNDQVAYQPRRLAFEPHHHDDIEKSYKMTISQRTRYVYQDSDWLETETAGLPWEEYQQKIRSTLALSLQQRQLLNQVYTQLLPVEIQLPGKFQTWRFNIRLKNKRSVLAAIFSAGLFASSHYASLAGIMDESRAPQAEALADEVINLFNDHHFTLQQAEKVCNILLENLS